MLMQITHGIKIKPTKQQTKVLAKGGKSVSSSKALPAKTQSKNDKNVKKEVYVDPQVELYQEQDMKVALSQQFNPVPKRR